MCRCFDVADAVEAAEHVDGAVGQAATGDHHRTAEAFEDGRCRLLHVLDAQAFLHAGEQRGFEAIGRGDGGARHELLAQRLDHFRLEDGDAATVGGDRIDHHLQLGMFAQPTADDADGGDARHHADLHHFHR